MKTKFSFFTRFSLYEISLHCAKFVKDSGENYLIFDYLNVLVQQND